ncbi:cell division protein SepF [Roseofilum reptotaenium CS-1145]|uniref:Cell division protein SepF n=1 Tax=Roseofilum reptotaenium AO1-A TaxID=1925591 RepID=A0A1L9QR40_9CYAN|nr:cell division protein SepF [Roseofilum reptotaenium]MDB9517019.1 cell division protein SepF [Roseofilum reptotaenium CS-1145]OJJ25148.1 cell division protein SepF [Roseofilum reptotaenium AO1-A]
MNLFSKLRDFVGLNEPVYDYGYDDELDAQEYQNIYKEDNPQPEVEEVPQPRRRLRERPEMGIDPQIPGAAPMNNVIGMPGAANSMSEVVVMEPRSFEEMPQAIQALRERKSVVLNLTMMDPDQAQRAVDFVAGGTYAIDGHQERIGESIFLFTPSCVSVKTQIAGMQNNPQSQVRPVRPTASSPSPNWTDNPAQMA